MLPKGIEKWEGDFTKLIGHILTVKDTIGKSTNGNFMDGVLVAVTDEEEDEPAADETAQTEEKRTVRLLRILHHDNFVRQWKVGEPGLTICRVIEEDSLHTAAEMKAMMKARHFYGGSIPGKARLIDMSLEDKDIQVWWEMDKNWYTGTVVGLKRNGQTPHTYSYACTVHYEDGEVEAVNLSLDVWRLASEKESGTSPMSETILLDSQDLAGVVMTRYKDPGGHQRLRVYIQTGKVPDEVQTSVTASNENVVVKVMLQNGSLRQYVVMLPFRIYTNLDHVRFATENSGKQASVREAVVDLRGRLRLTFYIVPSAADKVVYNLGYIIHNENQQTQANRQDEKA